MLKWRSYETESLFTFGCFSRFSTQRSDISVWIFLLLDILSGGRCRLVSYVFLTKSFDEELFFYRSDEGLTLETSPF